MSGLTRAGTLATRCSGRALRASDITGEQERQGRLDDPWRQDYPDDMALDRDLATFDRLFAFLSGTGCGLAALIERVGCQARTDDPLDPLRVAAGVAAELNRTADSLLGHYVDQARRAGASWSDVGRALGVTKQAAHERFIGPDLTRFTNRARAAVVLASAEASHLGYRWVAVPHLLLGLLKEDSGVAARALMSLGVSIKTLRAAVLDAAPGAGEAEAGEMTPPLAPQTMRLLGEAAPNAAQALGHDYIGTEHLLLALCTARDAMVEQILATLGVADLEVRGEVLAVLTGTRR